MDIEGLQLQLRTFARERDWEQFHTIKNLVLALTGEVGELAATVQWLEGLDAKELDLDPDVRQAFDEELADVFLYLVRLADVAKTDLTRVAGEKIVKNAKRYTIEKSFGNAEKQR